MGVPPQRLFRRAIEAARKALRDLDADQVPAELRRVAAHAGTLPPPLALALLRGIDRFEWLRDQASEAWPEADPEAKDSPDRASALLLLRPAGWVAAIAEVAAARGGSSARDEDSDLRGRLVVAEGQRDEWKRRAREEKGQRDDEARRYERRIGEERALRKALQAEPKRAESALHAEIDRLEAERDAAQAERAEAVAEVRRLRDAAFSERRRRGEAEAALSEAGAGRAWAGDPQGLAEVLDEVAVMARPGLGGTPGEPVRTEAREPLRLPEQVLPDSADALDWVLQQPGPRTLLVDGYNAGFMLIGEMDPEPARLRLGMVLERLAQVAGAPLQAIVVFDSGLGGDEVVPPRRGRVETRFTEEGVIADDRIVALARAASGAPVVITSDRELRERVEAVGALALWSEALVRWAERRRG